MHIPPLSPCVWVCMQAWVPVCVPIYAHACVPTMHLGTNRGQRRTYISWAGGTGGCEPPKMGARNWTLALQKSSSVLNHWAISLDPKPESLRTPSLLRAEEKRFSFMPLGNSCKLVQGFSKSTFRSTLRTYSANPFFSSYSLTCQITLFFTRMNEAQLEKTCCEWITIETTFVLNQRWRLSPNF